MRCLGLIGLVFGLALLWATPMSAQGLSTARATGLAGAYSALARGVDAGWWNPANLGLDDNPGVSIRLAGGGIRGTNNTFSATELIDDFGDDRLDRSEQLELLEKVGPSGFTGQGSVEFSALGFSIGRWALTFSGEVLVGDLSVPRDYFELLLSEAAGDQSFDLAGLKGMGTVYGQGGVSYGVSVITLPLFQLALGATAKYVQGFAVGEILSSQGVLSVAGGLPSGQGTLDARVAEGGDGIGLDLGVAARTAGGLTVGVSVVNALGEIDWDEDSERRTVGFRIKEFDPTRADPDELTFFDVTGSEVPLTFETDLPTVLRFGGALELGGIALAADWRQPLDEALGQISEPTVSGGVELRLIPFLPLRGGVALVEGSLGAVGVGLGLDLGPVSVDAGLVAEGRGVPSLGGKGAVGSVSASLWF